MKKTTSLEGFTVILSIGTILSFVCSIPFRFIALTVLNGYDYSVFTLTIYTFGLLISIGGLNLHSPFTRELRMAESPGNIKVNFGISYIITGIFGGLLMIILGTFILRAFALLFLLIFSLALFLHYFGEYFIAIVRSNGSAVKSALISSTPTIFQGLIIIPFFLNIQFLLNLHFFILLYCFYTGFSFFMGLILVDADWSAFSKTVKSLPQKINLRESFRNIKHGSFLSITQISISLVNWLITFIAILILDSNSFKIFDFCLYAISIFLIFGTNVSISALSTSDTENASENPRKLLYYAISGVILTLAVFLLLPIIPIEWFLSKFFNISLSIEGQNIIRISVFIPIFLFLSSFLNGKIQALGKYHEILKGTSLSFLGFLVLLVIGYVLNNALFLMGGLIIFYLIKIVIFYYYIYHS
jgi:O-antigen/teichoic acid export membrane protein